MKEKPTIEETNLGFKLNGEFYATLKDAIEAAGHVYVFIPYQQARKKIPLTDTKGV